VCLLVTSAAGVGLVRCYGDLFYALAALSAVGIRLAESRRLLSSIV